MPSNSSLLAVALGATCILLSCEPDDADAAGITPTEDAEHFSLEGEWALVERTGSWSDGSWTVDESPAEISIGPDSSFSFVYRNADTVYSSFVTTYSTGLLETTDTAATYRLTLAPPEADDGELVWAQYAVVSARYVTFDNPQIADWPRDTYFRR